MSHAVSKLRDRHEDLAKRAQLMEVCGFHASAVALREQAFSVLRQLWALGVSA